MKRINLNKTVNFRQMKSGKRFIRRHAFQVALGAVLLIGCLPARTAEAAEQKFITEEITAANITVPKATPQETPQGSMEPEMTPVATPQGSMEPEMTPVATPQETPQGSMEPEMTPGATPQETPQGSMEPEMTPGATPQGSMEPEMPSGNAVNRVKIRVEAVDDWDEIPLTGAWLTLAEKREGVFEDIRTDLHVTKTGQEVTLDAGEYRFTVNRTPGGYVTSKQPVTFSVTEDDVLIISAENAEISGKEDDTFVFTIYFATDYDMVMPATGGTGVLPYYLAGFLLVTSAIIVSLILKRKDIRKNKIMLSVILVAGMTSIMTLQTPLSVRAAEKGYTYYVMMKTDPAAEYYVEDESLAKALADLTVEGRYVFEVEKVSGENRWNVMTTDADCSPEDVAGVLATIKEQAITSAPLTSETPELAYGAFVLVKTKAGTYFVSEVQDSSQSLFERPSSIAVTKTNSSITFGGKDNAEIGQEITYHIYFSTERGSKNNALSCTVPNGLTLLPDRTSVTKNNQESMYGETGVEKWNETDSSPDGGKTYTMKFSDGVAGEKVAWTVTCVAKINEKAEAGEALKIEARQSYGDNENLAEPFSNNCYTFGFDVKVTDKNGDSLSGAGFTLKNSSGKFYTLPTEENNDEEERFKTVATNEQAPVVTTDKSGMIHFDGLAEGNYILEQTAAVSGYEKVSTPLTIKIADNGALSVQESSFTVSNDQKNQTQYGTLTIVNYAEELMPVPETGGSGTTFFYVSGGLLMLSAGILLLLGKRKAASGNIRQI